MVIEPKKNHVVYRTAMIQDSHVPVIPSPSLAESAVTDGGEVWKDSSTPAHDCTWHLSDHELVMQGMT